MYSVDDVDDMDLESMLNMIQGAGDDEEEDDYGLIMQGQEDDEEGVPSPQDNLYRTYKNYLYLHTLNLVVFPSN